MVNYADIISEGIDKIKSGTPPDKVGKILCRKSIAIVHRQLLLEMIIYESYQKMAEDYFKTLFNLTTSQARVHISICRAVKNAGSHKYDLIIRLIAKACTGDASKVSEIIKYLTYAEEKDFSKKDINYLQYLDYYELREALIELPNSAEMKCKKCGMTFNIKEFYIGRNVCKTCEKEIKLGKRRKTVTDNKTKDEIDKTHLIAQSMKNRDEIQNKRRKSQDESIEKVNILRDKYDTICDSLLGLIEQDYATFTSIERTLSIMSESILKEIDKNE